MIREQLLTQRMQGQLTMDITVTTIRGKKIFQVFARGQYPVSAGKLLRSNRSRFYPKISEAEHKRCQEVINKYRERVLNGDSFETLAILYSDDPGSALKRRRTWFRFQNRPGAGIRSSGFLT